MKYFGIITSSSALFLAARTRYRSKRNRYRNLRARGKFSRVRFSKKRTGITVLFERRGYGVREKEMRGGPREDSGIKRAKEDGELEFVL